MLKKSLDYLIIPVALAKREDPYLEYDTADLTIITFILNYSYNNKYEAQFNIRQLLKWFGVKDFASNIKKIKSRLIQAQTRYLNIDPLVEGEQFDSLDELKVNTDATLSFKPDFINQIEGVQYKRAPLSNIRAILKCEDHTPIDFSCYYLLLAGARVFTPHTEIEIEYSSLVCNYYSINSIASILRVSPITVKRSLTRLEELGIIRSDEKRKIGMSANGFYSNPTTYHFAIV